MTAQVIFINTHYYPDIEERRRLQLMQDKLHFTLIELAFQTREESRYQQVITKISYHEKFRKKWKIINGDKE
jgi:archaellum biogenesis protein FlaJ (TadC family)